MRIMRSVLITLLSAVTLVAGQAMAQAAVTGPAAGPAAGQTGNACSHDSQPPPVGASTTLVGVGVVSPCNVWAVGGYVTGTVSRTLVEHWNGKKWAQVPSADPGTATESDSLDAITVIGANNIWAAGEVANGVLSSTLIEHWNGRKWRVVASPDPTGQFGGNTLYGIWAAGQKNVWAVGYGQYGTTEGIIEHWNGTDWTAITEPNPKNSTNGIYLEAVSGSSAANVWAAGYFCPNDHSCRPTQYHWNGHKWTHVPSPAMVPGASGFITGISVVSATNAWAVGSIQTPISSPALIEHWDGHKWHLMTSALPGDDTVELNAVTATAHAAVAVGDYQANGQQRTLILSWNGAKWTKLRNRDPLGSGLQYSLLAVSGGRCGLAWMVGSGFAAANDRNPVAVHC
jgi:hypothetical protein